MMIYSAMVLFRSISAAEGSELCIMHYAFCIRHMIILAVRPFALFCPRSLAATLA